MTLITWNNGGPVLRDGKIGTEQACCCNNCCQVTFTVHSAVCEYFTQNDAYTEEELQELCGAFQAQYDCLKGQMESLGFTVTETEWPGCSDNGCPSPAGLNTAPPYCCFELSGYAQCCGFPNGGEFGVDPNWVDLWTYNGDPCGVAGTDAFVIWDWQFSCNQLVQPQVTAVDDVVGYWIPTCNPLP